MIYPDNFNYSGGIATKLLCSSEMFLSLEPSKKTTSIV